MTVNWFNSYLIKQILPYEEDYFLKYPKNQKIFLKILNIKKNYIYINYTMQWGICSFWPPGIVVRFCKIYFLTSKSYRSLEYIFEGTVSIVNHSMYKHVSGVAYLVEKTNKINAICDEWFIVWCFMHGLRLDRVKFFFDMRLASFHQSWNYWLKFNRTQRPGIIFCRRLKNW